MSGVGKGITTSSIALILKSKGFKVNPIKIDPYLNVDAGTMNPGEHGEVFVLESGLSVTRHGKLRKVSRLRSPPRKLHDKRHGFETRH